MIMFQRLNFSSRHHRSPTPTNKLSSSYSKRKLEAEIEFQQWCDQKGLSSDTRRVLHSEGFDTLSELRGLREKELDVLNLDSEQRNVLQDALQDLIARDLICENISEKCLTISGGGAGEPSQRETTGLYPTLMGFENEFSDPTKKHHTLGAEANVTEFETSLAIEKTPNEKAGYNSPDTSLSLGKGRFLGKLNKDKANKDKLQRFTDNKGKKFYMSFFGKKLRRGSSNKGAPETSNAFAENDDIQSGKDQSQKEEHTLEFEQPPLLPAKTLKEKFIEHSTLCRSGCPDIYQLPQNVIFKNEESFFRHCEISIPEFPVDLIADETVILCVGASGAGKTTLINGLANYLLGVKWEDPFRFQIVPDKEDSNEVESASQTQLITAYTFYTERNLSPSKVTVIDTPGFGDTQGINQDQKLDEKIRNLFDSQIYSIDQLHAVCFTTQATDTKMNAFQKYVYHRVLSIFGKDVEQNIFIMTTFADAQEPKVVKLLRENNIPFRKFFKFNNSALFASNAEDEGGESAFNRLFWNMGCSSFRQFFEFLDSSVCPVTLLLTKEVMVQREALQVYICGLQENVKKGLQTLDQMRQEMDVVRQHEADIARNKDFVYTVKEYYTEKIDKPEGRHVTNCQNCNRTCHLNCKYSNDEQKKKCAAMDVRGDCRICTPSNGGKCSWTVHYNMPYYFVCKEKQVEKRSEDLFQKYKQASDMKTDHESLLENISDMFSNIQGEVLWQTNEIRKCLKQLGEIALKPSPLSTLDYIDQMIIAEKDICQPGWRERIYQLETARQHAEYLQKLQDEGYDPWEEHQAGLDLSGETKESRLTSAAEFLHKLKSGFWGLVSDEVDEEITEEGTQLTTD